MRRCRRIHAEETQIPTCRHPQGGDGIHPGVCGDATPIRLHAPTRERPVGNTRLAAVEAAEALAGQPHRRSLDLLRLPPASRQGLRHKAPLGSKGGGRDMRRHHSGSRAARLRGDRDTRYTRHHLGATSGARPLRRHRHTQRRRHAQLAPRGADLQPPPAGLHLQIHDVASAGHRGGLLGSPRATTTPGGRPQLRLLPEEAEPPRSGCGESHNPGAGDGETPLATQPERRTTVLAGFPQHQLVSGRQQPYIRNRQFLLEGDPEQGVSPKPPLREHTPV